MICGNTYMIDAEVARDAKERLEAALLEMREVQLLQESGDCYPLLDENLSEAFGMQETSFYGLVAHTLKTKQYQLLGSLIMNMTNEYWEKQAAQKAQTDENDARKQMREEMLLQDAEGRN